MDGYGWRDLAGAETKKGGIVPALVVPGIFLDQLFTTDLPA
jgi:hypothetical protein